MCPIGWPTLTGAAVAGAAAYALTDREKAEPEELAVVPTDEETPDWISQLRQHRHAHRA